VLIPSLRCGAPAGRPRGLADPAGPNRLCPGPV